MSDKDKRDPFAPQPLPESLTGKRSVPADGGGSDPFAPQPLPASITGKTGTPEPAPQTVTSKTAGAPPPEAPVRQPPSITAKTAIVPPPAPSPEPIVEAAPVEAAPVEAAPIVEDVPVVTAPVDTAAIVDAQPEPALPQDRETLDDELRDAIGAAPAPRVRSRRPPTDDDDDDDDRTDKPRNRAVMFAGALALVVGAGITALVLLGRVNSGRYVLACEAERVVVKQGRAFPPWGETALTTAEWRPLVIPPEAPCTQRETEDKAELAGWFGKMLEDQATSLLTAREVSKVDDAEANLKQALLVARSLPTEDARIDTRERIERLLGDVGYWRASARLQAAAAELTEAAKQFDAAALQKPRYVTDAAAWAAYVRKLVEDLQLGPSGTKAAAFPPLPPSDRPSAPPGVELPVEPDAAGSGSAVEAPVAPPPDAGAPTGGVLL